MTSHAAARTRAHRASGVLAASVLPALVVTLVVAVGTWALRGETEALSALVGGLLALAVFALGVLALRGIMSGPAPSTMAGAVGVLVLQLVLLATALLLLRGQEWVGMAPLAIAFVVAGVVFLAGLVRASTRLRTGLDVRLPGGSS